MNDSTQDPLQDLLQAIEAKLGWGPGSAWNSKDFGNLSELIMGDTGVSLSPSTLRRVWGRVKYSHAPSVTTLDALSKFLAKVDWRTYRTTVQDKSGLISENQEEVTTLAAATYKRHVFRIRAVAAVAFVLTTLCVLILSAFESNTTLRARQTGYELSARLVSSGVPNSVVFSYTAPASTDSLFFQQSWDERTKTAIPMNGNRYTSIYYEPGFFQAKLMAGTKMMVQTPVLIASKGWCAYVQRTPVPVYLDSTEVFLDSVINLSQSSLQLIPGVASGQAPLVKIMNVGNFDPVPINRFHFQADVKNGVNSGAFPCRISYVVLVTDGVPIIIPLSAPGCISNLKLYDGHREVSGRYNDLSDFGVNLSKWVNVACRGGYDSWHIYLNDRRVYSAARPVNVSRIVGYGFFFEGAGMVKRIRMNSASLYPDPRDRY